MYTATGFHAQDKYKWHSTTTASACILCSATVSTSAANYTLLLLMILTNY